jgi:hypothetical protein
MKEFSSGAAQFDALRSLGARKPVLSGEVCFDKSHSSIRRRENRKYLENERKHTGRVRPIVHVIYERR